MLDNNLLEKAEQWLSSSFDEETRNQVQMMIEKDHDELTECFYKSLDFGTGGMRGLMGVGTNRMNQYTVGMSTQGLANYLIDAFPNQEISIAIAHDCRNNSIFFSRIAANVLSGNGIKVYLFDELKPTPELSYTIRHFGCQSGIVITASHNPKEYNGYKVYWEDGAQIIPPHDVNVIEEVRKISNIDQVKFIGNPELIVELGSEVDELYIEKMKSYSLSPSINIKHSDLKIVFTPIHGTGVKLVPMALKAYGFSNVYNIPEQDVVDGNFPTVISPNPEESAALKMALDKAREVDAELILATDPDADRVGAAVKDGKGDYILLNGNQTAALLTYYILERKKQLGQINNKQFIVKTIVTTDLLIKIANDYGVGSYDVLTGFKYIAEIIRNEEGKKEFLCGGEESYGFLVGDYVRDKDAVIACAMLAETTAWAQSQNLSLLDLMKEIYLKYGMYKEGLISITKKGKSGAEEIAAMMQSYRENPIQEIDGSKVVKMMDYKKRIAYDFKTNTKSDIDLPASNVLQFSTEDGSIVTMRPSGTEPKIKFYFGVRTQLNKLQDYEEVNSALEAKIDRIKTQLG